MMKVHNLTRKLIGYLVFCLVGWAGGGKAFAQAFPGSPADVSIMRSLNDKDFFFVPPKTQEEWSKRSAKLREKIEVSLGLYPKPAFAPLAPVVRKVADRDGYSVNAVYFESVPGLLVTGSLYLPKNDKAIRNGKRPAVLCPHGHWENGRFYENSEANAKKEIESGAESTLEGARYPLQARCANLALLGVVVFHYDMIGYADQGPISHRNGFLDPRALLHLQGQTQLQTINSLRALDFVLSLSQVDPRRIGVTGASGGGTQTFLLGALDERPAVAFPAVMVGSRMQGGCVCENAPYLRVGTGNVEIAGLFYPRPLAMSGANDWTIAIEKEGLPELKKLYSLSGNESLVEARCWPEFGHNYNQKSREFMYAWMNRHLGLGAMEPFGEKAFQPVPPAELAVFDKEHARPSLALTTDALRARLEREEMAWIQSINPNGESGGARWKKAVGPFVRTAFDLDSILPSEIKVQAWDEPGTPSERKATRWALTCGGPARRRVPYLQFEPNLTCKGTVIWVGTDSDPQVGQLLAAGNRVIVPGASFRRDSDPWKKGFSAGNALYTYGYNRPGAAESVRDICALVRGLSFGEGKPVIAGPEIAALAGCLLGDEVKGVVADLRHFNFKNYEGASWGGGGELALFLPGSLRFGGMPGLLAANPPERLVLFGVKGTGLRDWSGCLGEGRVSLQLNDASAEGESELVESIAKMNP